MKFTPKDIKHLRRIVGIEEPEPPKPLIVEVEPIKVVKKKRKWVRAIYNQTVLETENPDFKKAKRVRKPKFVKHRYA